MILHLILFPGWYLLPTVKHFKSQPWTSQLSNLNLLAPLPLSESKD